MRKVSITILLLTAVMFFQFCSSTKKAATAAPAVVTYEANIKPLIEANCTPCHIAGKGNKKSLDNYSNAKDFADDIIARIHKNPGERGFMPMRNPKLSDSTIAVFAEWKSKGLLEK
ncbi:MAG: hypothetical protein IPP72_18430 [Chitinophagaceae bacterium]|nr:hypothetical protein [Chitinophagaceae bacterium]